MTETTKQERDDLLHEANSVHSFMGICLGDKRREALRRLVKDADSLVKFEVELRREISKFKRLSFDDYEAGNLDSSQNWADAAYALQRLLDRSDQDE